MVAALFLMALPGPAPASSQTLAPSDEISAKLQSKILEAGSLNRLVCRGEFVCGIAELPRFYAMRGHLPAWLTVNGPSAAAEELIQSIEELADGLRPSDYHIESLRQLFQR
jgi:hypothetical protein